MKRWYFVLVMWLSALTVGAESYMFSHLAKENKLSHNQVNSVYKDVNGHVWISTAWGLNRFDGYDMRVFLNDASDSTSLPNNYVDWVKDISGDRLIIRNASGYTIFDKRTEKFSDASSLFGSVGVYGYVDAAFVDAYQRIWFTSEGRCYLSLLSGKQAKMLNIIPNGGRKLGQLVEVTSSSDEVLLFFGDGSIYRVHVAVDGEVIDIKQLDSPLSGGTYVAMIDSDGDYWVVVRGMKGVWFYEKKLGKWHYCSSDKSSYFIVNNSVASSVCEDGQKRIWLAGDHDGISVIDKHTRNVVSIMSEKEDDRSLLSNSINCVYRDAHDVMWIGYCTEGLSFYHESIFKMRVDKLDIPDISRSFKADVNCIEEDRNGNLWFGTNGNGLLYKNVRTGEMRLYRHNDADVNSLSGDVIVALHSASDGSLWVGTYLGGLCRYDGKKFVSYKGREDVPKPMSHENVWSITEDSHRNIWIGSLGEGVVCYDPQTGESKIYNDDLGLLSSDYVSKIVVGRDGHINIGTASGVTVINPSENSSRLLSDKELPTIRFDNINDIYEDSRGMLWIGTRGGLSVYDKKSNVIERLTMADGLNSDVVNAIVEDGDRNMWITTTNGVTHVVVNINPREGKYTYSTYNYDSPDGVLSCVLNLRAIKRTSYNEILIGGSNGVNIFTPSMVSYNKTMPEVRFVGLSVLGEEIKVGEKYSQRVVLDESLIYTKELELAYSQNMFKVSFSTMSNILPEKVRYSYMLEGFNEKWLTTDRPNVTYTNLAPGRYTLKVKAANCDGFASEVASELNIVVLPPWWRTTWACVCYFILLATVVLFIRRQIMGRERERYRLKQIEADIQKQHEVDDMKLKFFTNVSHELRTPLSLIISPLEQLMVSTTDVQLKGKLEMIYRNATKLLGMVNQLLDFRKNDLQSMQFNPSEGDIVGFVKNTCENYKFLSERHTQFVFSSSMNELYTEFDRDKMTKILDNLLSNAFKFTPEEGRIDVWVGKSADGENVIIKVSDSGVGIADKYKKHVFERFYQVPQADMAHGGSGIGLHMVQEFVKLHGGTVEVGDNVGQGSVFVVTLPIRQVQEVTINEDEIMESAKSNRRMILIVDDNADFRQLLQDTFKFSYDTLVASNGEEALKKVQKHLPDLIITDVMMPVMNGLELCRAIKNDVRYSHIPVIMLTAKTAEEHKIEGLSVGADDYISKPFNPQILTLKVSNLIEIALKRQEAFQTQIDPEPSQITITPLDETLINKAIKYVEANISRSELSVEELSRNLGMSRVHLYKKLMAITGRSPIEFIRVIRLKRAAQMLADKQQNIADVAYAVGFNNPKYFSKYFKEEFGVLPSVYQNNQNGIQPNIDLSTTMEEL